MKGFFSPLLEEAWMQHAMEYLAHREPFLLSGAGDSVQNHLAASFSVLQERPILVIAPSELRAKEIQEELSFYDPKGTVFFPAKDQLFYGADSKGQAIEVSRIRTLRELSEETGSIRMMVMSVDAFYDRLVPRAIWKNTKIRKRIGDELPLEELIVKLTEMGYERCEQVEAPGQYAVRGGIVDLYPIGDDSAIRIELWGDEIDSIRAVDPETQRSMERMEYVTIYPAAEIIAPDQQLEAGKRRIREEAKAGCEKLRAEGLEEEAERLEGICDHFLDRLASGKRTGLEAYVTLFYDHTEGILDYLPDNTILVVEEPARIRERVRTLQEELRNSLKDRMRKGYLVASQADMFPDFSEIEPKMSGFSRAYLCSLLSSSQDAFYVRDILRIESRSLNVISGSGEMLQSELKTNNDLGYRTILLTDSSIKAARTVSSLEQQHISAYEYQNTEEMPAAGKIAVAKGSLKKGFSYPSLKFSVISMQELTERARPSRKRKKFKGSGHFQSFGDIRVGDYVVHENHGVGIYQGIVRMQDGDSRRDYFKIVYKDGGVLYVPTTSLDLLQKYVAMEGQEAKLNNLSGVEWERTKKKVKEGVAKLAQDLTALYAERMNSQGYAFSEDSYWQREFEDSFPYEETDDQLTAIAETKKDMESGHIMDRLICGDVGYGKTEVAIRAAFKAVQDSKQVALLAPTTILAKQHYNTFSERMRDYPVNIAMFSRFSTPKQVQETLQGLKDGKVDIVIGTHKLLGKNVVFHNLGLLVIDEEQRFGVSHKEKIKSLKKDVDVLTLTATPIPRTLHMSLSGMRDMSLLEDAPQDRHPVQTYVMEADEEMIREALYRELSRGGQVFYLHNRVEDIDACAQKVQQLVPEARVVLAHGQMNERELEKIMVDFVDGSVDVLVCTTIIETGLDIPNANTLIVENADSMGLAQLYQLRGRVGRSSRLAYAYFLYRKGKVLSEVAQKRLEAIGELTDFGSGYKIALRDLQIRGAGNVLGPEQHGHMGAVGYDLYCKLLADAMATAKHEEIPEAFETLVQIKADAYIPADYIRNESQKLDTYKRIAMIKTKEDLEDMTDELIDRFGDPPQSVMNLLTIALIKATVSAAGCDLISYERALLTLRLRDDAPMDLDKLKVYLKKNEGNVRLLSEKGHQKLLIRVTHNPKEPQMLQTILDESRKVRALCREDENEDS